MNEEIKTGGENSKKPEKGESEKNFGFDEETERKIRNVIRNTIEAFKGELVDDINNEKPDKRDQGNEEEWERKIYDRYKTIIIERIVKNLGLESFENKTGEKVYPLSSLALDGATITNEAKQEGKLLSENEIKNVITMLLVDYLGAEDSSDIIPAFLKKAERSELIGGIIESNNFAKGLTELIDQYEEMGEVPEKEKIAAIKVMKDKIVKEIARQINIVDGRTDLNEADEEGSLKVLIIKYGGSGRLLADFLEELGLYEDVTDDEFLDAIYKLTGEGRWSGLARPE